MSLFFTCVEVNADDNQQTLQFTAYESCPYVCSLKKKPFRESHTDSNNRHKTEKGFLVDIVEAIFNQASINVNVDILPTARALKLAREGKADGIIGVSKRQAPSLSFPNVCSAIIKQDTLIMEYNPIIEVLNDKTNKQNLYG